MLTTSNPNGVLRDVAAQAARGGGVGVRGIEEPLPLDGIVQIPQDHAWLDDRDQIVPVDLLDAGHGPRVEHDSTCGGHRSPGSTRPTRSRRHGDAGLLGHPEDGHQIVDPIGVDDQIRHLAHGLGLVANVALAGVPIRSHLGAAEQTIEQDPRPLDALSGDAFDGRAEREHAAA